MSIKSLWNLQFDFLLCFVSARYLAKYLIKELIKNVQNKAHSSLTHCVIVYTNHLKREICLQILWCAIAIATIKGINQNGHGCNPVWFQWDSVFIARVSAANQLQLRSNKAFPVYPNHHLLQRLLINHQLLSFRTSTILCSLAALECTLEVQWGLFVVGWCIVAGKPNWNLRKACICIPLWCKQPGGSWPQVIIHNTVFHREGGVPCNSPTHIQVLPLN